MTVEENDDDGKRTMTINREAFAIILEVSLYTNIMDPNLQLFAVLV